MWLANRSCAVRRRPGVTAVVAAAAWQHGPGSVRRLRTPGTLPPLVLVRSRGDYRMVTTTYV